MTKLYYTYYEEDEQKYRKKVRFTAGSIKYEAAKEGLERAGSRKSNEKRGLYGRFATKRPMKGSFAAQA